jgi:hypothetical protein
MGLPLPDVLPEIASSPVGNKYDLMVRWVHRSICSLLLVFLGLNRRNLSSDNKLFEGISDLKGTGKFMALRILARKYLVEVLFGKKGRYRLFLYLNP